MLGLPLADRQCQEKITWARTHLLFTRSAGRAQSQLPESCYRYSLNLLIIVRVIVIVDTLSK